MTIWEYSPPPSELAKKFHKQLRTSRVVAELLARRGIESAEEARLFLDPRLSEIVDPFHIPNLKDAAKRISQAIDNRQRIVICGDYDVDGVTSTALLVAILRKFENYPSFIVPLRLEEGYGLTQKAAERALEEGPAPDLFIALDCGTNSVNEAKFITSSGCDLIIVDHHQSKADLPQETLLVNPHVFNNGDASAMTLCTVGLVFKLAHGLLKLRRDKEDQRAFDITLRSYLDLVSMGTLADLVPLRKENRTFAKIGLQELAKTKRQGLRCLMQVSGINASHGVKPVDISFKIGPRINASGRLADASVAVELILSEDPSYSMETSLKLDSFNRERQDIEKEMTDEAIAQIDATQADQCGLVVLGENWHPGVVGIVASRVSKAYNRPSIVLGKEGDMAKGSGRSIDGINLVEVLSGFADHLDSWGGHPMAVGISMPVDKVDEFADYFDQAVRDFIATHELNKILDIHSWICLEEIDTDFMSDLAKLEPFGQENPEPLFGTKGVVIKKRPVVFKDHHFKFSLRDNQGRCLNGVAWKMAERIPKINTEIDILYRLVWNSFANRKVLQLELVDWRSAR